MVLSLVLVVRLARVVPYALHAACVSLACVLCVRHVLCVQRVLCALRVGALRTLRVVRCAPRAVWRIVRAVLVAHVARPAHVLIDKGYHKR